MRINKVVLDQDMDSPMFNLAGRDAYRFPIGVGAWYGKHVYVVAISRDNGVAVVGVCPGYAVGKDAAYDEELSARLAEYGATVDELTRAGLPAVADDDMEGK